MKNSEALEDYNQFQSVRVSAVKHFATDFGVTISFYKMSFFGLKIIIGTVESYTTLRHILR